LTVTLEPDLLDELQLTEHSLMPGRGGPSDLLFGRSLVVGFNLVGSTTLGNGIIMCQELLAA
jgi:hypothetical protein